MYTHALILSLVPTIAFGGVVKRSTVSTNYLATFEGIQANILPALSTAAPPTPYQGLNYQGAVVVVNNQQTTAITDVITTQGTQFIAVNTLDSITISVPDASETFDFTSAYLSIYLSTDNSAFLPALDGTLSLTGTRPDGSKVVATYNYVAGGPSTTKSNGVVVSGRAAMTKGTFTTLTGLTSLKISVATATSVGTLTSLLSMLGIGSAGATYGLAADSFAYTVTTRS